MRLERASTTKKTLIIVGVCGLSFFAGALAMKTSDARDQMRIPKTESYTESNTGFAESGANASLGRFFGLASPQRQAEIAKALNAAALASSAPVTSSERESPVATAWKQSTIRLKYLDGCVKSQKCESFGQQNPDDYYLETRLAQAAELREFRTIAKEWQDTFGGSKLPAEAREIAQHFLKTGDDYVKEAAFELIQETDATLSERDAIIKALMDSGSGVLYEKAMTGALLKYKGDAVVDRMLLYQAARGSTKVQNVIAMQSLPYLTSENQGPFEIIVSKKNPRSVEVDYWRANFAEKSRMNEGG